MNHDNLSKQDQLALVAELEHYIRHSLRSAKTAADEDEKFKFLVRANQAKYIRRDYMAKHFPELNEKNWCLTKVSASLEQLATETFDGDFELFRRIMGLCDDTLSDALGVDLHSCEACQKDKAQLVIEGDKEEIEDLVKKIKK